MDRYKDKLRTRKPNGTCVRCEKRCVLHAPKFTVPGEPSRREALTKVGVVVIYDAPKPEEIEGWYCRTCNGLVWDEMILELRANKEKADKRARIARSRRKKLGRWAEQKGVDQGLIAALPDAEILAMRKDALRLSKAQIAAVRQAQAKRGERRSVKLASEGNVPLTKRLLKEGKTEKEVIKAIVALYRAQGNQKPEAWLKERARVYIKIAKGERKGGGA